jgi:hypothetical protein
MTTGGHSACNYRGERSDGHDGGVMMVVGQQQKEDEGDGSHLIVSDVSECKYVQLLL